MNVTKLSFALIFLWLAALRLTAPAQPINYLADVKDFGVVCDGATHSGNNAALTRAFASGRGLTVTGNCKLDTTSGPFTVTNWSGAITFHTGAKFSCSNSEGDCFGWVGGGPAKISGMELAYTTPSTNYGECSLTFPGYPMHTGNCWDLFVQNTTGFEFNGLKIDGGFGIGFVGINDINLRLNGVTDSNQTGAGVFVINSQNTNIANVALDTVADDGMFIGGQTNYSGSTNFGTVVSNYSASTVGGCFFKVGGTKNVTLTGFHGYDIHHSGLCGENEPSSQEASVGFDNVVIAHGTIQLVLSTGIRACYLCVFNNAGIDLQTDATGAFGGKFFVSDVIFQDLDGQGIVAQNHIDSTQATELGLQGIHLFNIGANGLSVHSTPSCSSIANVATVRLDNVECVTSAYDGFNFSAVGDIFADNVTAANINTTNSSSHVFFYANGQNTVQANNIKILDLNNPARAYTYGENSTADYGNFTNITSYLPHGTLTPSIGSGSKIDLYGKLGKDFRLPAVTTAFFPSYADGPAALAGGLTADDLYVNTTWGHIARAGVGGAVPNNYPVYSVNTQQGAVVITGASLGLTFSDIGGVASVGQIPTIPSSKVTGLAAVATSGSASDITTGTLPSAQLPAGPATSVSCGMAGGTPVATVTVTADSHGRLTGVTCAP